MMDGWSFTQLLILMCLPLGTFALGVYAGLTAARHQTTAPVPGVAVAPTIPLANPQTNQELRPLTYPDTTPYYTQHSMPNLNNYSDAIKRDKPASKVMHFPDPAVVKKEQERSIIDEAIYASANRPKDSGSFDL